MTGRPIGRATLVLAMGLLLYASAPSRAAETADDGASAAVEQTADAGKPLALIKTKKTRTQKASSARKAKVAAVKAARKAAEVKKAAENKKAKVAAEKDNALPTTVANANAQMPGADARGEAAMSGAAPMEIAAADQLNELDKALAAPAFSDEPRRITTQLVQNDQPEAALPVMTSEPARPVAQVSTRPTTQVSTASSGDAWAQSSLIGKIFIAFGGMLTLASAARMLVA